MIVISLHYVHYKSDAISVTEPIVSIVLAEAVRIYMLSILCDVSLFIGIHLAVLLCDSVQSMKYTLHYHSVLLHCINMIC